MEVITTHVNADFDAFASMMAAKKLYPDKSGFNARFFVELFFKWKAY